MSTRMHCFINYHYPHLRFEHEFSGHAFVRATRRCDGCGHEETVGPGIGAYGEPTFPGGERWITEHHKCRREET